MDLLKHYWQSIVATVLLVGSAALVPRLWKWAKSLWGVYQVYAKAQSALQQTQERLADGYQGLTTLTEHQRDEARKTCEELNQELEEVKRDLRSAVREVSLRDDINRQDRALIRALESRLRKNHIDYSDIAESIQNKFDNQ